MRLSMAKFYIAVLLVTATCSNYSAPEKMPLNLKISYKHLAGRMPTMKWKEIFISEDHCFYKNHYNHLSSGYTFKTTRSELAEIYRTLKKLNFDRIKSDFNKTMDRGGTSISISWDKRTVALKNGGDHYIQKKWEKSWNDINDFIEKFVMDKLEKQKVDLKLAVKSLLKKRSLVMIYANDDVIFAKMIKQGRAASSKAIRLLPGRYRLNTVIDHRSIVETGPVDLTENGIKIIMTFSDDSGEYKIAK